MQRSSGIGKRIAAIAAAGALAGAGLIGLGSTAASAAPGQILSILPFVLDGGEPVMMPIDEPWQITASSGGMTYSNSAEEPSGLMREDVAAGTYRITIAPYQDAFEPTSFMCTEFDIDTPYDWTQVSVTGSAATGWNVPVGDLSVTCLAEYHPAAPLPDPRISVLTSVLSGDNADGSTASVGDESDFQVSLRDSAGALHPIPSGGELQLPAGTYTTVLGAAATPQAGFDLDEWTVTSWTCAGHSGLTFGGPITLTGGTLSQCQVTVANIDVDLSLDLDATGDFELGWDGIFAAAGTSVDFEITVENDEAGVASGSQSAPFAVIATLGDNMQPRDPFVLTSGYSATPQADGTYLITRATPLAPGETARVQLGVTLNGNEPTSPFGACVVVPSGLVDADSADNCEEFVAVGDGSGGGSTPEPTQSPEPTPAPTATATATPTATPAATTTPTATPSATASTPAATQSPEPSASVTATPTASASANATPIPAADRDPAAPAAPAANGGLASTGADTTPMLALVLALVTAGGTLLLLQRRRERRGA